MQYQINGSQLSSIPIPLEMKPQLENIVLKLATKAMTMRIFPFTVDNLEGNILQLIKWKLKEMIYKRTM